MVHMMNCPNCHMPQPEGTRCACGCPVTVEMREELERRMNKVVEEVDDFVASIFPGCSREEGEYAHEQYLKEKQQHKDEVPPVLKKPAPLDEWKFEI